MIAYSVSDKGNMAKELVDSLKSLNRFVNRDNIVVFYTPPCSKQNYNNFTNYAIVEYVDNIIPPFKLKRGLPKSRYGEIIGHLGKISTTNVCILDCDTIIKKDLKELFNDDFDVAFRVATQWKNIDKLKWENLFEKNNKTPIPMPNKGFMVFKNNVHKKIMDKCIEYMNLDLPHVNPYNYQKDQIALALAISGYKLKFYNENVHAYQWLGENDEDTYVFHGHLLEDDEDTYNLPKKLKNWFIKQGLKIFK